MRVSILDCILTVCFLFGPLVVSVAQCTSSSQPSSDEQLLSVLRNSVDALPQERNGACITFVIKQLENKYSDEGTTLLIRYLDFERPIDETERAGFMFHGPPSIENSYPATGTLMSFGKRAVPALLAAIAEASSTLLQRNATYTVMLIFREHPENGILSLREKSLNVTSDVQSKRLQEAARESLRWCGSHLDACESAENAPLPTGHCCSN